MQTMQTAEQLRAAMSDPNSMAAQCLGAEVAGCRPDVPRDYLRLHSEAERVALIGAEQLARERAYLAELDALPDADIPDEPAELCWDCRRMYEAGAGPQAETIRAAVQLVRGAGA